MHYVTYKHSTGFVCRECARSSKNENIAHSHVRFTLCTHRNYNRYQNLHSKRRTADTYSVAHEHTLIATTKREKNNNNYYGYVFYWCLKCCIYCLISFRFVLAASLQNVNNRMKKYYFAIIESWRRRLNFNYELEWDECGTRADVVDATTADSCPCTRYHFEIRLKVNFC